MDRPSDDSLPPSLPPSPDDWEARARETLTAHAYDYFAGGAGDEVTLRANRSAWTEMFLRPRVLVDVSEVDPSVELLGTRLPHPVVLAPTAFQRLAHPDGEIATARAAAATGSLLVASSLSTVTIEEIGAAATGPLWLQLYVFKDRGISADLVQRGRAAGCRAVCRTVSVPVQGNRERDARNGFKLPEGLDMANFRGLVQERMPDRRGTEPTSGLDRLVSEQFDASLTWDAVDWLRGIAGMPVVLKGIMTREDARLAVQHGVSAVVVSNHGGRQLEGAWPTSRALRDVVEGVEGKIPVRVDGGIRRGGDVLREIALGATAVQIGRPYLWGLAAGGQRGVERVVELLVSDLKRAMALTGCPSLRDVDPGLLAG